MALFDRAVAGDDRFLIQIGTLSGNLAAAVKDYRDWQRSDAEMQKRFNRSLRESGILKGDSKFYVSLAHDEADIRHALAAVRSAVEAEAAVPAQ